ncbi:hypothetical protein BOTBODRAFT_649614 [Botryobasidium botryosum FD-172 SS1]|uniref:Uncharacterized protein n=1 Tax=Botryobasidium botryosum (strain FD-172 SS1) TaxID=930990 RepID=A0A067M6K5_BOTB1|nr:hypothetical protein BOTBODRAFT_649614 [Botryobasidium botryosum FD-172 SS1]
MRQKRPLARGIPIVKKIQIAWTSSALGRKGAALRKKFKLGSGTNREASPTPPPQEEISPDMGQDQRSDSGEHGNPDEDDSDEDASGEDDSDEEDEEYKKPRGPSRVSDPVAPPIPGAEGYAG